MTVEGGPELAPRIQLTASAYSLNTRSEGGNTLDQEYDQGGPGAGRTIIADAGAVNIAGTDGLTVEGSVGIGTTTPANKLTVKDSSNPTILIANTAINQEQSSRLSFGEGDYTNRMWIQYHGNTDERISINSDSYTNILTITRNTGNVGIGTTGPLSKLHIVNTPVTGAAAPASVYDALTIDSDSGNYINLRSSSSGTYSVGGIFFSDDVRGQGAITYQHRYNNVVVDKMFFNTNNAERMTIDGSGNVGIGTANPAYTLDVAGKIRSSSGGFVFPNGTEQTTAATGDITGVYPEPGEGLAGGGDVGEVTLSVADGGITTDKIADGTIVDADISSSAAISPGKISGTAWTSLNDGIGSNLDADKLDGLNSTDFLSTNNDYGRQGVATDLYEGSTKLTDKYVNVTGDTIYGNVSIDGNVGIGTPNPQSTLAVNGTITAREVVVTLEGWPDFVLKEGYPLMPLREVEQYIKQNKHLPAIPSEKEVLENGVSLGEMQSKLLQKVEELTLYMIEQNKKIEKLEKENEELKNRVSSLEGKNK
ncbi:hypothetical protein FJZ31_19860 [Candidatus Poribacteria bacterium]|nr:hypothetical protein [Candidatus Poribacteria bacterium]